MKTCRVRDARVAPRAPSEAVVQGAEWLRQWQIKQQAVLLLRQAKQDAFLASASDIELEERTMRWGDSRVADELSVEARAELKGG